MPAKGTAEWRATCRPGPAPPAGDTISGEYWSQSRFEDGPGANPEQLIAAAHAACFSMALANILAQPASPPASIRTEATVTLRPVDGADDHEDRARHLGGTCPDSTRRIR